MFDKSFVISAILLAITAIIAGLINLRGNPVIVATNIDNLPRNILDYSAIENSFSKAVYDELNADIHVYRNYRAINKSQIDLYIGYYGTEKGGRTPHNPNACFSSAGWAIIKAKRFSLRQIEKNVNLLILKKGDIINIVFHWYQSEKDKILATGIQQNFQRLIGKILHNRNDGAFVRVSCYASGENYQKEITELEIFTEKLIHILSNYWPEERES